MGDIVPPDAHPERPGVVQRAFQLAKSGEVADIAALMARLVAEGYPGCAQTLAGRSVSQQLTRMINEARGGR
jgi:hypothetical protein